MVGKKRIRTQGPRTRSQKELFPAEELRMEWSEVRRVGSGLTNLGNTCFMNSVLQCLIHTPPLAELLLSGRNVTYTRADHGELDPIGMTQRLIQESLMGKREYVSPVQHAKSLKRINRWCVVVDLCGRCGTVWMMKMYNVSLLEQRFVCILDKDSLFSHSYTDIHVFGSDVRKRMHGGIVEHYIMYGCRFRLGRQEDAHEYLIALLDAMHDRSISGMNPKPSRELEYTSFIYRIFGGKIRSQLKCTQCDYESNTYDPFLDLSLEITRAHSVQKALQRFTAGEVLDGANSYKCPKQNTMVKAVKRMTIEDVPNVLIVQLKRFEFSRSGRKISKHVDFDPVLDISPFMSHPPKHAALYDLYGILVHQGHSMHSGHYYCFLKGTGGGEWHKFDDTRVCATSSRNAMGQSPYILFYTKRQACPEGKQVAKGQDLVEAPPMAQAEKKKKKKKKKIISPLEETKQEKEEAVARRKGSKRKVSAEEQDQSMTLHQKKATKRTKSESSPKEDDMRPTAKSPLRRVRRGRVNGYIGFSPIAQHTAMLLKSAQKQHAKERISMSSSPSGATDKKKKHDGSAAAGPPRKTKRANGALAQKTPNGLSTGRKDGKAKVRGKDAIAGYKTSTVGMGLQQWDDVDIDSKRQRDRNMWKTVVPRREIDAYDAEYDKGKTKRIKDKTKSGGYLGSMAFDVVAKKLRNAKKGLKKSLGFGNM